MKKIKNYIPPIIAGLLSLIVFLIIMYLKEVTPFGDKSFLTVDFLHQYAPMLKELFNRVLTGKSLIYSFNMGLGLPFYRNFFNYLSSPFNIILFLFREKTIITSYSIIIALKLATSSTTMCLLLNKKFKNNYMMIALSILYSLSAYFMAYYWNIMWLDGIVFLPLIILGIERLVDDNKPLLYIISLSLMIYANYFIAYMIAIFSLVYFFSYLLLVDKKNKKMIIIKFIISSALVGGLCFLVLLPMFISLKSISATSDAWPTSQYYAFTLKEFIFNHLSGVGTTVFSSGETNAPNISLGILSILLISLFCVNKKVDPKVKCAYFLPYAFLLMCFLLPGLDFIMHGFHVPNDLPYRYSFLYVFMLTIFCGYSIDKIKDTNVFYIIGSIFISLGFILLSKVLKFGNISDTMFNLNIIIASCYFVFLILYKYLKKLSFIAIILFILTASFECVLKYQENWEITYKTKSIYRDYDNISNSLEFIRDNDKDIFRIDRPYITTFNDPDWFDYYGLTTFSSMSYEAEAVLMHSLGVTSNEINSHYYKENTPIFNMMFNLRYVFSKQPISYFYKYESNMNYNAYKSSYPTSLMFKVNSTLEEWKSNSNDPFSNQNDFIKSATGILDVLKEVPFEIENVDYYEGDKTVVHYLTTDILEYYIYFPKRNIDFVIIGDTLYYMSDDYYYGYGIGIEVYDSIDYNENYVLNVKEAKDIYIGYSEYYDDAFNAYYVDEEQLDRAYSIIKDNLVKIDEFSEHYIKGTITSTSDGLIYTSIPFDRGWQVFIDGKRVDSKVIANTLLAFEIGMGKHTIELKYRIPFLIPSLITTLISVPLIYLFNKKIKKN